MLLARGNDSVDDKVGFELVAGRLPLRLMTLDSTCDLLHSGSSASEDWNNEADPDVRSKPRSEVSGNCEPRIVSILA